jgi:hypothetical protein
VFFDPSNANFLVMCGKGWLHFAQRNFIWSESRAIVCRRPSERREG